MAFGLVLVSNSVLLLHTKGHDMYYLVYAAVHVIDSLMLTLCDVAAVNFFITMWSLIVSVIQHNVLSTSLINTDLRFQQID